jgi:hypothetical protein
MVDRDSLTKQIFGAVTEWWRARKVWQEKPAKVVAYEK